MKSLFLFALLLGVQIAHAKSDEAATLFFTAGSGMSRGLFEFLASNSLEVPLTIRNVSSDREAKALATRLGQKCGLAAPMLGSFPLLVVSNKCVVNDHQIMKYMERHSMISVR